MKSIQLSLLKFIWEIRFNLTVLRKTEHIKLVQEFHLHSADV